MVRKYFGIGLLHCALPEKYGGAGLGFLEGCLFGEELAVADAGVAPCLDGNILAMTPFHIAGSEELKEELLPRNCSGPNLEAWTLPKQVKGGDEPHQMRR